MVAKGNQPNRVILFARAFVWGLGIIADALKKMFLEGLVILAEIEFHVF